MEKSRQIIIKPRTKWTDICGSVEPVLTMEEVRKKIREMRSPTET